MSTAGGDPFREFLALRAALDRLFEESFVRPRGNASELRPAIDIYETPTELVIEASVAGLRPEELEINIAGDVVTIRGEPRAEPPRPEGTYVLQERSHGPFRRTISLPNNVEAEKAEARYEHGVLTLTLPKAAAGQPRQIRIKGPDKH